MLTRAKVEPREGDAQKALRRTYISSSLICGRNPKLVASEVGHTTARMVMETYDSFIDPANWPEAEIARLKETYGWATGAVSVPEPSLNITRQDGVVKSPAGLSARRGSTSGARDRARTGDPHVGKEMRAPISLSFFA